MRPLQWYKNLVLFVGIIFALRVSSLDMWLKAAGAFIIFCLLSGGEYIINDLLDVEKDRQHPKKSKRLIASGRLKAKYALASAVLLIAAALAGAYLLNPKFFAISVAYLLLVLSYSLLLKNIIIVDVLVISVGFVLRAIAGCWAISVFVSPWLILCAFLLALFMALGKRRHELSLLGKDAKNHRKILEGYTISMLDQMITITTSALVMSYSLYTFLIDNVYMMITIPFAVYGIFRYILLLEAKEFGDEPEMLFSDRPMLATLTIWFILSFVILYTQGAANGL